MVQSDSDDLTDKLILFLTWKQEQVTCVRMKSIDVNPSLKLTNHKSPVLTYYNIIDKLTNQYFMWISSSILFIKFSHELLYLICQLTNSKKRENINCIVEIDQHMSCSCEKLWYTTWKNKFLLHFCWKNNHFSIFAYLFFFRL